MQTCFSSVQSEKKLISRLSVCHADSQTKPNHSIINVIAKEE